MSPASRRATAASEFGSCRKTMVSSQPPVRVASSGSSASTSTTRVTSTVSASPSTTRVTSTTSGSCSTTSVSVTTRVTSTTVSAPPQATRAMLPTNTNRAMIAHVFFDMLDCPPLTVITAGPCASRFQQHTRARPFGVFSQFQWKFIYSSGADSKPSGRHITSSNRSDSPTKKQNAATSARPCAVAAACSYRSSP